MIERKISEIVVHHSASAFGDAQLIRHWHVDERGWGDIGYHYVICNGRAKKDSAFSPLLDGLIEFGRDISIPGAHVPEVNPTSIGICLIGEKREDYTDRQLQSLVMLIALLKRAYPFAEVKAHKEYDPSNKPMCPDIGMDSLRAKISAYETIASSAFKNLVFW
jgi:hypothetical protein